VPVSGLPVTVVKSGASSSCSPRWIQLERGRYLKTFLVGLVDDHSRYVIGLRILPAATAEPILAWR